MNTKNKMLTLLCVGSAATVATALLNKAIIISATSKNLMMDDAPQNYGWRFGNIYYTVQGTGKPLLLLHDLTESSSSYEWNKLIVHLKENYTVYAIDLLGCGRSEKPNLTYTNYLYVQLISDFIRDVIGKKADILASGASCSIAIMACNNSPDLFNQLMLINPDSFKKCMQIPNPKAKLFKFLLDLPVLGTLMYHIAVSKKYQKEDFQLRYFFNPYLVKPHDLDVYNESAHRGQFPKALYSSMKGNYTKLKLNAALGKIDNSIYLVGGSDEDSISDTIFEYRLANPAVEYSVIKNARHLPHMEKPEEVMELINIFFSSSKA